MINKYKGVDIGYIPNENECVFYIPITTRIYSIENNTIEYQGGDGALAVDYLTDFIHAECPPNLNDSIFFQEKFCIGAWFLDKGENILLNLKEEEMYVIPISDISEQSLLREKINWVSSRKMTFENSRMYTENIDKIDIIQSKKDDELSYKFVISCKAIQRRKASE